jgi:DNA-binding transcriptional LysR family regulator
LAAHHPDCNGLDSAEPCAARLEPERLAGAAGGADLADVEPLSRMDFALLRSLVETGNLRGAAKTVNLTQGAAWRRISRLERRLGARLVQVEHERATLTEAGWALLAAGRRLLRALESAISSAAGEPTGPTADALPTLRLAAFGTEWDDLADELSVHAPGMVLSVRTAEPHEALEMYEHHQADAIYLWTLPGAGLRSRRPLTAATIVDEPLWVALPADHRCADKAEVSLPDLADDCWITGPTDEARELLQGACGGVIEPRVGYVVDSAPEVRSLLGHGQGVALASPLLAPPRRCSVFVVRPLRDAPRRRHVLVSDPTIIHPRLADVVRASLTRCYQERAAQRNAAYRNSADFPLASTAGCVDPVAAKVPPEASGSRFDELFGALSTTAPNAVPESEPVLEPEDLHLLRVVNECGSLNRAAPILLITQPALTRRIGRLERRLGLSLLQRGHRGTTLTATGRQLLEEMGEAESGFRSVLVKIRRDRTFQ